MFLVVLAYLAFFSIALPDSMLGVAWPAMSIDFAQPLSAAGLVPPVGVVATLVATSGAPRLAARLGVGRVLAGGTLLAVGALVVTVLATGFETFLAGVVLGGLSAGVIDATLNAFAARTFGPRRINYLHASYVAGAAASPLLVTATIGSHLGWRAAYAMVAAVLLAVGVLFWVTRKRWDAGTPAPADAAGARRQDPSASRPWKDVVLGLAAVAIETGIESAVALWAFTYLTVQVGVPVTVAGVIASGYWVSMFAGRVVLGQLAERVGAWPVLAGASAAMVAAAALVQLPGTVAGCAAVLLFGFACAPIYPLLILTTSERTSAAVADQVVGYQAAASSVGAAIVPGLVGLALAASGRGFGLSLAACVLAAAGLQVVIQVRRARRVRGTS